jgi:glutamate 5-kinase
VPSVIAHGGTPGVVLAAAGGRRVGTRFAADQRPVSSYKLWLRYGKPASGRLDVDAGARRALTEDGASLLPVGVVGVHGRFAAGDGVEIAGPDGAVFAKGLAGAGAAELRRQAGQRGGAPAVHRDELAVFGRLSE